ncbi:hypothetical protein HAX54_051611 [Datura stramonium]|uniref:Uncharacterized protein n=1 Tax=Datura stramonium TaxID=4076 RepID=A0ABS8WQ05_DATST|nr:hypothetical protein [Datura stramonium]
MMLVLIIDQEAKPNGGWGKGAHMQEVLGGENGWVTDGITVNNDSKLVDVNGNQDCLIEERLIEVELKNADGIGVGADALVPERRGAKHRMEEEGKFYASDLVWGGVESSLVAWADI